LSAGTGLRDRNLFLKSARQVILNSTLARKEKPADSLIIWSVGNSARQNLPTGAATSQRKFFQKIFGGMLCRTKFVSTFAPAFGNNEVTEIKTNTGVEKSVKK
jgi:hypothetical protein